jgi:hypothetical protein
MTQHPAPERLILVRLGQLSGEESRELLNHVAACAECQRAARASLDTSTDARELAQSLSGGVRPRRSYAWFAAAAIAAGVLAAMPLLQRDRPVQPRPTPPVVTRTEPPVPVPEPALSRPARPEPWNALVAEAVRARALPAPAALLSLEVESDQFRDDPSAAPPMPEMRPLAAIVESDRPRFEWPEIAGATYIVLIGEQGRVVARSPELAANRWRSHTALPRGRTYSWQVETRQGEETSMLPPPPLPMPRFRVLDAKSKAQLDSARRSYPADHLLVGILAARAGLRDLAVQQLRAAADAGASEARPLLDSVAGWPR